MNIKNSFFNLGSRIEDLNKIFDPTIALSNIKFFYYLVLGFAFVSLTTVANYSSDIVILPQWPVYWTTYFSVSEIDSLNIISLFLLLSTFLASLRTDFQLFRIATFVGTLELVAFNMSFGNINHHSEHLLVLVSFMLIFLPNKLDQKISSQTKIRLLAVYLGCQALILLTYTLSGFWKIESILSQTQIGEATSLHPKALAYQVASRLIETNSSSILGDFIIKNYFIGWPLYLGSIYIEACSLFILFKPKVQKLWAAALILFHVFIFLTMTIPFILNVFCLFIFFTGSPYKLKTFNLKEFVSELPLLGFIIKKLRIF